MPPKQNSKKEVKKAQQKVIEDKTFGLKNKNKSKVLNPCPTMLFLVAFRTHTGFVHDVGNWCDSME